MTVPTRSRTIGFDRKIRLEWLDATAYWVSRGLSTIEIRRQLTHLLEGEVAGAGPHSARGKTITVLLHIWMHVPDGLVVLRDEAAGLIQERAERTRLPVHWGMCLVNYPFFREIAAITGRLLALQGTATRSQISRRVAERWGERSAVLRASQRVVRSMVDWNVLAEKGSEPGTYSGCGRNKLEPDEDVRTWLLEAVFLSTEKEVAPLSSLVKDPALFPFELGSAHRSVADSLRLELASQSFGESVVRRRANGSVSRAVR